MSIRSLDLLDKATTALFALVIMFSFCGLFLVPAGQTILSNLLVVASVFGLLNYFVGKKRDVGLEDRRILWVLAAYAVMIFVNRLIHGDQYGVMRGLFYVVVFALMIPRKPVLLTLGYAAIVTGGIGLGIMSLWQYQSGMIRVEGFTNAILFSQAALTLAILNWFVLQQNLVVRWMRGLALLSLVAALFALYLSQSRGVWLAFGGAVVYIICYKGCFKPWKYAAIALLCVAALGATYHHNPLIQKRIAAAVSDMQRMDKGSYDSSWGLRVVAWQSAWLGFVDAPVFGVGTRGFDSLKQEQAAKKLVSPLILHPALAHAHNQYMQNIVIRGGVGFFALAVLLFYPIVLAIKNMGWMSAGVLIPLTFAINGLSDVPFEHQNVLYAYALSLIFIWYSSELRENKSAL
ncbi:O-antigen ligase family protein [Aeromonas salmonicida]|uniref:O-antigen ligase family protein n=1 Tax=Aeromonas salmonicida TaxID=645 RepID=UPI000B3FCB80|nr:O-antigen ligase family protein [Aeromonas salmonicida]ARW84512.1 O-antigen ligase [Aeromonas salmonicida]